MRSFGGPCAKPLRWDMTQQMQTPASAPETRQVDSLLHGLEESLGRLRNWQQEQQRQEQELAAQTLALSQRRKQVEARRQRLASVWAALRERRAQLVQQQQEFTQQQEQSNQELAQARQQMSQRRGELEARAADVAAKAAEVEARLGQLDQQRQQLETLRQQCLQERQQLDGARGQLAEEQAALTARRKQLETLAQELAQRQEQLSAQQVQRAARDDGRQKQQMEQAWQQIREQQALLEHARASLEEEKQSLMQREKAAAEQQTALKAQQAEVERQWQQIEEAQQEAQEQAADLENEQRQLVERLERQLAEKNAELQQLQQQVEEQRRQIESQGEALSKLTTVQADRSATDQFFQELAQREEALQKRRVEIEHQEKSLAKLQQELEHQRQELKVRQEALEKTIRSTGAGSGSPDAATDNGREQELLLRQQRLERYHQLLRERSKAMAETERQRAQQPQAAFVGGVAVDRAGLQQQRQALLEVKQFLEASEAEMVRRWATRKAASLATTALLAVAMLAIFSTMLGHRLTSPVWQATAVVDLPIVGDQGAQPTAQDLRQVLLSEPVVRGVLSQLRQRNVRLFGDVQSLTDNLDRHTRLVPENGFKTRISYQASGDEGRELSVQMTEAIARSMVLEHLSKLPASSDLQPSIVQPAVREPLPVRDWRWPVTGFCFTLGLAVFTGTGYFGWRWLQKVPRVLETHSLPAVEAVTNDVQWEALKQA